MRAVVLQGEIRSVRVIVELGDIEEELIPGIQVIGNWDISVTLENECVLQLKSKSKKLLKEIVRIKQTNKKTHKCGGGRGGLGVFRGTHCYLQDYQMPSASVSSSENGNNSSIHLISLKNN